MCVCEMIQQSLAQGQREGSSLAGTVGERSNCRTCSILWYTVLYCGILWYTVIYCSILWYTVIYCGIL